MIPRFRAFHNGKIVYVHAIEWCGYYIERVCFLTQPKGTSDLKSMWVSYDYNKKNIILMQSTGLKDKSGQEIFEGDVVKDDGSIYEVLQNCSGYSGNAEILGNKFENPELLERDHE